MNYRIYNPRDVLSPTSKNVKILDVIFNGETNEDNPYSIVRMQYGGKECYGIRWNISQHEWEQQDKIKGKKICLGLPSSRGYPTWFILPLGLLSQLLEESNTQKIQEELIKILND